MSMPVDPEGDDLVPLSALNAFHYCERRSALRHTENLYVHNEHTRRGELLHKRADKSGVERRKGVRTERGLWIASRRLGLYGRADLVEFRRGPGRVSKSNPLVETPYPVEYKRGRRRRWDNDEVQLCAQALCLEEMCGVAVPAGAIFHARSKERREILFDHALRSLTETTIQRLQAQLASKQTPPAVLKPQCRGCSLREHCLPDVFGNRDVVAGWNQQLFKSSLSDIR